MKLQLHLPDAIITQHISEPRSGICSAQPCPRQHLLHVHGWFQPTAKRPRCRVSHRLTEEGETGALNYPWGIDMDAICGGQEKNNNKKLLEVQLFTER